MSVYSALTGLLFALLGCALYDMVKQAWTRTPLEREAMAELSKRRRQKWVKRWLQYQISEILEEGYYTGKISQEERDFWLQRAGSRLDMLDLLPKNSPIRYPDPEKLKETIKGGLSTAAGKMAALRLQNQLPNKRS